MSQLRVHTAACVAVSLLSATPLLARGYPGPSGACRPPHLSRHQTGVAAAPDVQMVFSNGGPAPRLAGHRCTGPAAAGWAGRGRRGLSDLRPGIPSRVWSRWCSPPQPQPHWHVHVSAGIYMISFSLPTNNLKIKHLAYLFTVYRQNLIFLEFFAKLSVDTFDIAKITFSLMLYHLLFQEQIHFHKKVFLKSKKKIFYIGKKYFSYITQSLSVRWCSWSLMGIQIDFQIR